MLFFFWVSCIFFYNRRPGPGSGSGFPIYVILIRIHSTVNSGNFSQNSIKRAESPDLAGSSEKTAEEDEPMSELAVANYLYLLLGEGTEYRNFKTEQ